MYTIVLPDISDIRYQILQLYIQHAYLYIQHALPADWRYCMLSSSRRGCGRTGGHCTVGYSMPASRLSRGGGVGVVTSALAPPTPIKNALSPVTLQRYCPVTLQPYCATIRHIRDTGTGAWGQGGLVTLQPPCYTDGMRQQSLSAGGQKMSTDTMTALPERYGWTASLMPLPGSASPTRS